VCVARRVNSRVTGWLTHPDAIARLPFHPPWPRPVFPVASDVFRFCIAAALTHMRWYARGRGPARTGTDTIARAAG